MARTSTDYVALVVGDSACAERLRRQLARRGTGCFGVAGHLRGVRRACVAADADGDPKRQGMGDWGRLIVMCIDLNRSTLSRHRAALRGLLDDRPGFPQSVRAIGLLPAAGLSSEAAELGCDLYVHTAAQAVGAVRRFALLRRIELSTDRNGRGRRLSTGSALLNHRMRAMTGTLIAGKSTIGDPQCGGQLRAMRGLVGKGAFEAGEARRARKARGAQPNGEKGGRARRLGEDRSRCDLNRGN